MEKDNYITEVIFRKYKDDGQILALFPYSVETPAGNVGCYQHVGQHGSGDYDHCIHLTTLATKKEYADLKKDLELNFGYDFKVMQKRNYDKYLKAYHKSRQ